MTNPKEGSFGQALKRFYNEWLREPVPDDIKKFVEERLK